MGATAAIGAATTALGKVSSGYAQRGALDAASNELTQEAGQSVAAGIQGATAMRRRTAYIASNAQSRIAAGGLSTTGTSAQAVLSGIHGQGEYEALTQLYQGYDRANELNFRASQMRTQGLNAVTGGWVGGVNTVLGFAGSPSGQSFFDKYNS